MPRRPRIHLDGVPLHIVQRGHNREPCFFGEEDYQAYLHWLGEALQKEHCSLHAYALMTNHVHLLVTPERAESIPQLIIALPWSAIRGQLRNKKARLGWISEEERKPGS